MVALDDPTRTLRLDSTVRLASENRARARGNRHGEAEAAQLASGNPQLNRPENRKIRIPIVIRLLTPKAAFRPRSELRVYGSETRRDPGYGAHRVAQEFDVAVECLSDLVGDAVPFTAQLA